MSDDKRLASMFFESLISGLKETGQDVKDLVREFYDVKAGLEKLEACDATAKDKIDKLQSRINEVETLTNKYRRETFIIGLIAIIGACGTLGFAATAKLIWGLIKAQFGL